MSSPRVPSALESLARLRTMRALLSGEDRTRFESLVAEVEQGVWEVESVATELARLVGARIADASRPTRAIELTELVGGALRALDPVLASRGVLVDVHAAPAIFAIGDPEQLEYLIATALAISAAATQARGHAQLRYGMSADGGVELRIAPFRARDPRVAIVQALGRAHGIHVDAADNGLTLKLPGASAAALA